MDSLRQLGWTETLELAFTNFKNEADDFVQPARVTADYGMQLEVQGHLGIQRAELGGSLRHSGAHDSTVPCVGDWVALRAVEEQLPIVTRVLPRSSELVRRAPGKRETRQIIGANLDVVFVVTSLNKEFNLRRLDRYMTAIRSGGARPVVILNKADLVESVEPYLNRVRTLSTDVDVFVTDATRGTGVTSILDILGPGKTGAFVGSSGVGKSTLVNALIGDVVQKTGEIRENDARGRHTTSHRQLIVLPQGNGIIIDTPGMREFQMWADEESLEEAFPDIAELSAQCHFRDCTHENERRCAVLAAISQGVLEAARLSSFNKLKNEMRNTGPSHRNRRFK